MTSPSSASSCSSSDVERELEVVEDVERQVVPGGEAAEDEVRDRGEAALARDVSRDLVHLRLSAVGGAELFFEVALAAAALPCRCEPPRRPVAVRLERGGAVRQPGREAGDLLHRPRDRHAHGATAVSALSAMSTALSVTRSTLSSCPFTRSTLSPILSITGSSSFSVPSDERGKPAERFAQAQERVREAEPDRDEEDGEGELATSPALAARSCTRRS